MTETIHAGVRQTTTSERLFAAAQDVIPGGVNSPVRAARAVGAIPLFIDHGAGAYLYDADGNRYTDYVCSWGPLIAGHAHPRLVEAVTKAAKQGTSFGAPTALETQLALEVRAAIPSMELVRFVSSGTEATMSALRVARAFTGRDIIVKVEGGYHGHADGLLAHAGSGPLTLGAPDSPGVPAAVAATTINVPFNDLPSLERVLTTHQVAAFIVEPVPANMGVVPPEEGYLHAVRELTRQHGALLIFDEVITGFRVAYGGAQALHGVQADLTCLGKIIGGGLPVGAYGGRRDIMSLIAPSGPVYQAGTLSGNPLAISAGLATLALLREPGTYERLEALGSALGEGLARAAHDAGVVSYSARQGSMMTLFFTAGPVVDYSSARTSDTTLYAAYYRGMRARGIYLAPSQFEAAFVSLAHSDGDIDETVRAAREVFANALR